MRALGRDQLPGAALAMFSDRKRRSLFGEMIEEDRGTYSRRRRRRREKGSRPEFLGLMQWSSVLY